MVDAQGHALNTAVSPFEQFSQEPWYPCQWRAGDGTVCGVVVSRTSLSEHLRTHGIKMLHRGQPLECHWLGCQAAVCRGNILRHIRGVHLRPPNPVQASLTNEAVGHLEDVSSLENPSTSHVVEPTVRDGSSYAGEDVQMAVESPIYPIIIPFEQLHPTSVGFCEWHNQDGTGTTCGEALTCESLSWHLRKHGIKDMPSGCRTMCLWIGCEKLVKRESIVRHIREVHLGLKRPPA